MAIDLFDGPDDFLDDPGGAVPGADEHADLSPEIIALLARIDDVDDAVATAAVVEIHRQQLAELQDPVVTAVLLQRDDNQPPLIDAVLDYLTAIGDGRCVRPMESALAKHGRKWTEHQAWRGRHIVQKIRRFGRK